MALVIRNGSVLLPGGELCSCDVLIQNGLIQAVGPSLESETQVDATGGYVVPGLIDLHTHGIRTESAQAGALSEYARIEASFGTTTFYPTLFCPPEESAKQMERHRRETNEFRLLPQIGGFRLESPYLARTGAGLSKDLVPIGPETTEMLLSAAGGHVRIWDVSPELERAPDLIRQLSRAGIVCSIAHTQATIEQGRAAVDAGARLVTHLFDVFEIPASTGTGVYPQGLVDYLLVEDRVTCEIIGDGTHVSPLLVEKTFRCKPSDRLVFITDSNYGAGLPPGRYVAPGGWGTVQIDGPNNGVRQVDRNMGLAGSALTPIDSFRNAIRLFHKDIATASHVWSRNPARLMGLNKGEIAPGRDADLIVLDQDLDLVYTIVAGEIAYQRAQA
ncbi:MAG: amidohydrolase family protein [Bacillota bacterium]|nr:amidohydrolase family protein [Bacillota bacterium]